MSASKTNFFQGIASLLKEMSKTFTDLSSRVEKLEEKVDETKKIEEQLILLAEQHSIILKSVHSLSTLQQDIAKQIVKQHQDVEALYLALGLKKDLSYYSFDMTNTEEH